MGVTFWPSSRKAESFSPTILNNSRSTAHHTFAKASDNVYGRPGRVPPKFEIFKSSFPMQEPVDANVVPVPNGLVDTVLEAWNHHRMLVIRPDDVWIAILTQFCFFVNANAEALRGQFVPHQGRKTLELVLTSLDTDKLAAGMTELLQENITDPSILEWVMPDFSTTAAVDKTVSAIVMMSTFQKYFDYKGHTLCGIPAVTLEGTKADWQAILRRIEKLKEYGLKTTLCIHLLRPIIRRFIAAFDDPSSESNLDFWNRAITYNRSSGGGTFSGWITAFCVFNRKGTWVGPYIREDAPTFEEHHTDLDTPAFWEKFMYGYSDGDSAPVLDGAVYRQMYGENIPPACVGVDIQLLGGLALSPDAGLVAGLGAYSVSSSGDDHRSLTGKSDMIQPMPGWWLYLKPKSIARPEPELGEPRPPAGLSEL